MTVQGSSRADVPPRAFLSRCVAPVAPAFPPAPSATWAFHQVDSCGGQITFQNIGSITCGLNLVLRRPVPDFDWFVKGISLNRCAPGLADCFNQCRLGLLLR